MPHHFNTFALQTLIKQAEEKEDKKKKKTKKYSTKKFESKVGTNPMTVVFNKRTDGS
jgi:DNA-binding protein YbaB